MRYRHVGHKVSKTLVGNSAWNLRALATLNRSKLKFNQGVSNLVGDIHDHMYGRPRGGKFAWKKGNF